MITWAKWPFSNMQSFEKLAFLSQTYGDEWSNTSPQPSNIRKSIPKSHALKLIYMLRLVRFLHSSFTFIYSDFQGPKPFWHFNKTLIRCEPMHLFRNARPPHACPHPYLLLALVVESHYGGPQPQTSEGLSFPLGFSPWIYCLNTQAYFFL